MEGTKVMKQLALKTIAKNDHRDSMAVLILKGTNDVDIYFMVFLMSNGEKGT